MTIDQTTTTAASTDSPSQAPPAAPQAQAAPASKAAGPGKTYIWGLGRRKTSVARVRIRPGSGSITVNKKKLNDYFRIDKDRGYVELPLRVTNSVGMYDVFVNVKGGGTTGQAGAIVLGLARALEKARPELKSTLKEHRLLSRDPRKVERKKYGQRGARRRFQFSKR